MSDNTTAAQLALYERVCESYHSVDDFRMKLLGLLPVATGAGVFLLLNGKAQLLGEGATQAAEALLAIGLFGFLFTAGLFAYELFGIKKCHYLIVAGKRLEADMGVAGQFQTRPRELAGFINEPYASAIIYPASMAAWTFLAFAVLSAWAAGLAALVVFALGYKATRLAAARIKANQEREEFITDLVRTRATTVETIRAAARDWERRCDEPSPDGVAFLVRWVKSHLGSHSKQPRRTRLEERRQAAWVEDVILRLQQRGDLEVDGNQLRLPGQATSRE